MKKMKKRVAVSCYEFQIVGLERSKRGLRGRPTAPSTRKLSHTLANVVPTKVVMFWPFKSKTP